MIPKFSSCKSENYLCEFPFVWICQHVMIQPYRFQLMRKTDKSQFAASKHDKLVDSYIGAFFISMVLMERMKQQKKQLMADFIVIVDPQSHYQ